MLPIKFWLNPTYGLGDVIWRIWRWRPWRSSWISERYNFSNSESLCCSNASHQVLAQSHLRFQVFQDGHGGHLGYGNRTILASLYNSPKPPIKFQLNLTLFGIRCCLKNFKMDIYSGHLGYLNGTILAILNLCVTVMLPIKFWLNPTFGLGGDVVWRISRRPPWRPSWISERNKAILNLYVAPMPPIKFRLNLTYGFDGCRGGHLGYRNEQF